jgi:hypothetical protein
MGWQYIKIYLCCVWDATVWLIFKLLFLLFELSMATSEMHLTQVKVLGTFTPRELLHTSEVIK